jgi:hypothetical protein
MAKFWNFMGVCDFQCAGGVLLYWGVRVLKRREKGFREEKHLEARAK